MLRLICVVGDGDYFYSGFVEIGKKFIKFVLMNLVICGKFEWFVVFF